MPKAIAAKEANTEAAIERASVKIEKDTAKTVAKSGAVKVMFGLDPTMPKDQQFLEYCINGVIYRYPRGVMVEVPAAVFETIERKERHKMKSMQLYSSFQNAGQRLDV